MCCSTYKSFAQSYDETTSYCVEIWAHVIERDGIDFEWSGLSISGPHNGVSHIPPTHGKNMDTRPGPLLYSISSCLLSSKVKLLNYQKFYYVWLVATCGKVNLQPPNKWKKIASWNRSVCSATYWLLITVNHFTSLKQTNVWFSLLENMLYSYLTIVYFIDLTFILPL